MVISWPEDFYQSHHQDKDFTIKIPGISGSIRQGLSADILLYGDMQDVWIDSSLLGNS